VKRESVILAECLEWLALHRIFAWRNNTGAVKVDGRWIRYGQPGSGDILGILPHDANNGTFRRGSLLSVECKTPLGRQSKQQKLFQTMIEQSGGCYLLVRSARDLEERLLFQYGQGARRDGGEETV
jgi:hypothetical protein